VKTFVPLRPAPAGLSIYELETLVNGRDVYVWGCGHLGRILSRNLKKHGLPIKAFCDSNPSLMSHEIDGLEVISPALAKEDACYNRAFIIIASVQHKDQIENECIDAGLMKNENFTNYLRISRPEAAIDIAGKCNLKCASCPRGNMNSLRPEGHMPAEVYEMVLAKLLREIPYLMQVELSTWGEPFMNPCVAEIIEMTERHVPCTVSTNLQIQNMVQDVLLAQPSQLIISAGGYGKSYEESHEGASWELFLDNLHQVKNLLGSKKLKTQVTVLYHLYRNNKGEDLDRMRKLCVELGLKLVTTFGYICPYDNILDYCRGSKIGEKQKHVVTRLCWNFDRCLYFAKRSADKPCLCQRIFPIINWDLSVALCHTYYHPIIANNYLEIPIEEIIDLRLHQDQCRWCQQYGLHRLDIEILKKEYPAETFLLK